MKKLTTNVNPVMREQTPQLENLPRLDTVELDENTLKPVPPKTIYGHNLLKLKSFKNMRRECKANNMKTVFVNDLSVILSHFVLDPTDEENENDLNDELLVEILNLSESYFIYFDKEKREELKVSAVHQLMLPYFRNDKKLLEKTILHVWNRVDKSTMRKRLWAKSRLFFLSIWRMIVMSK